MTETCLRVVRELLDASYNAGGISTLAFDLFQRVHSDFSSGMTKAKKIRIVVEYAGRNGRIPDLLEYIRSSRNGNPYQYNRFAERLKPCYQPSTPDKPKDPPLPSDDLPLYDDAEQSWYAPDPPQTRELDANQAQALQDQIDVVIITATQVELKAVMHLLQPYPRRRNILSTCLGPETYYLGKFGAWKATVTKCRMGAGGEGGSALATATALRHWRPRAIIMVGIAFGKDATKQKISDVFVASQIIPYEKQRVGSEVIFRDPIPPGNTTLLNRFENALAWQFHRPDEKRCQIRFGPLLSGEKLVDDATFKSSLFRQFPQAIGGEMEGAGLAAAAGRNGTAWILVKGICDWGDGKKHDNYQPLAAAAATSLVHHVLSKKNVIQSIKKG